MNSPLVLSVFLIRCNLYCGICDPITLHIFLLRQTITLPISCDNETGQ